MSPQEDCWSKHFLAVQSITIQPVFAFLTQQCRAADRHPVQCHNALVLWLLQPALVPLLCKPLSLKPFVELLEGKPMFAFPI